MKKLFNLALALMITTQVSVAFATGIVEQQFTPSPFDPNGPKIEKVEAINYSPDHGLEVNFSDAVVRIRKTDGGIEGDISSSDGSVNEQFTCKVESDKDLENCLRSSPVQNEYLITLKRLVVLLP